MGRSKESIAKKENIPKSGSSVMKKRTGLHMHTHIL